MTEYRKTFKTCRNVWWISIAVLLLCWSGDKFGCYAQDDFQDDAGADTSGNDATNDMMDQDPNVVNPQKNQNSGFNIPDTIMDNQGRSIACKQKYEQHINFSCLKIMLLKNTVKSLSVGAEYASLQASSRLAEAENQVLCYDYRAVMKHIHCSQ